MLSNYLNDPENSFDISAISHGHCSNTKHKQTQHYYLAISNQRWLREPRPGPGSAMLVVWQVSRWPEWVVRDDISNVRCRAAGAGAGGSFGNILRKCCQTWSSTLHCSVLLPGQRGGGYLKVTTCKWKQYPQMLSAKCKQKWGLKVWCVLCGIWLIIYFLFIL